MKKTLLLFLAMLLLMGARTAVNAQELTVSDIQFTNLHRYSDNTSIVLTKEGSILNVQLLNYQGHPSTQEFVITPKMSGGSDGELYSVFIDVVPVNFLETLEITSFNVSFNVHGLEINSFHFSCGPYDGQVNLTEGEPLVLENILENVTMDYIDGFAYSLHKESYTATFVAVDWYTTGMSIFDDLKIPSELEYEGQKYTVTGIYTYTFARNTRLTCVTIPSSLEHIGGYAFYGCDNLVDFYCYADNVPVTGAEVFGETPIASATLHVPAGSVEKYKTTSPWSEFGNIVALPEEPARPLPFLEGNPIWVFKYEHILMPTIDDKMKYWLDVGERYYLYFFLGKQKVIEDKVYTMMGEVASNGKKGRGLIHWLPVREEDGVVYAITDSLPGVVDNIYKAYGNTIPYPQQGNECVLYNFRDVLYPQDEGSAGKSFDTYQLMDGTTCRVLSSGWSLPGAYVGIYDLYEKLGYVNIFSWYGVMDPLCVVDMLINRDIYAYHLNAYYQDDTMLFKAPDVQEGLCVNDTCWTQEDACAYAMSYRADPYQDEVMAYIRQLQTAEDPVNYTKDQIATIILPTEPDASKGKYYRLDRCEDNQIIFEQELQPRARVPYIIVPVEDFSIDPGALNLEGLHSDTVSIEGVSFIGSYVREELPTLTGEDGVESSYIDFIDTTPDCGPSISAETGKESLLIGTLRAYLIVKWDDPIDHGSPSVPPFGKKEIVLHDYSTGINSLTPDPSPRRGEVFDLQGRRIDNSKLPRGIYIKDKKKVLIK